jgi:hypothetical protein
MELVGQEGRSLPPEASAQKVEAASVTVAYCLATETGGEG